MPVILAAVTQPPNAPLQLDGGFLVTLLRSAQQRRHLRALKLRAHPFKLAVKPRVNLRCGHGPFVEVRDHAHFFSIY